MLSISKVQELASHKSRTWRRATIDQKHLIADTFEKLLADGIAEDKAIRKAYRAVRYSKVELSDLTFAGQRYGGGR
jgi:hypothetical protein